VLGVRERVRGHAAGPGKGRGPCVGGGPGQRQIRGVVASGPGQQQQQPGIPRHK